MSNLISSKAERDRIRAENEAKILSFLLEEHFSTPKILAQHLRKTPNGTQRILRRMEANGLIKSHSVDFELSAWNQKIWGLTPTGTFLATPEDEDVKFFEVSRIKPVTMTHSLNLQRVKVTAISQGWSQWESSSKMLQTANKSRLIWVQIPDAVGISPRGRKAAIELERTLKTPKRYVEILANYAEMLASETIAEVVYICPDYLVKRLERQFHKIEKIIFKGKVIAVHESLLKRFYFISYEKWEVEAQNF